MYYTSCVKLNNHNCDQLDKLQLEQKYKRNNWATRVNMTIMAMAIVDCWKVYAKLTLISMRKAIESRNKHKSNSTVDLQPR
jgi:hypothetical protein